jgi:hypothetical protein
VSCLHVRAVGLIVLVPALLVLAAGCGESPPKTYPVYGKVVFKGKGKIHQLASGSVQFQSTADPNILAAGELEEDGSFSLGTFYKEKLLAGVPAGEYKARVIPPAPDDDDEEDPRRPSLIHPKYKDFEKSGLTFIVAGPEDITIEVEPGPVKAVKPKRK